MNILFASDYTKGTNTFAVYQYMKSIKLDADIKYIAVQNKQWNEENGVSKGKEHPYDIGITDNRRCLNQAKAKRQKDSLTVNLHHGNFFLTTSSENGIDISTVQSASEKEMLCQNGYRPEDVYVTGAARTDELFGNLYKIKTNYLKSIGLDPCKKTILYAPTYDRANFGFGRKGFYARWCSQSEEILVSRALMQMAEKYGYNVIIRVHRYYKRYYKNLIPEYLLPIFANAHICSNETEQDSIPSIAATDVLITDFSSIITDYLLLNRPIIFIEPHSGWKYTDKWHAPKNIRYEFGEVVEDCRNFIETIHFCIKYPEHKYWERKGIQEKYSPFADGQSSKRVVEAVLGRFGG